MKQLAIVVLTFLASSFRLGAQSAEPSSLECEVLETSAPPAPSAKALTAIRYVIVRQRRPEDRDKLSGWLRIHSGTEVTFAVADGRPHHGVLWRLRMCFGRGLLIFSDRVTPREKETIIIYFSHDAEDLTVRALGATKRPAFKKNLVR